jgi:hypothetical protein
VLSWVVLQSLAELVDALHARAAALDLFDRLRLREPLAHAFAALGLGDEDSWRAAARVRALLTVEAGAEPAPTEEPEPVGEVPMRETAASEAAVSEGAGAVISGAIRSNDQVEGEADADEPGDDGVRSDDAAAQFWDDADVRWLTGLHDADGASYFDKERYEELMWWLQLPTLLSAAAEVEAARATLEAVEAGLEDAFSEAEDAGYKLNTLLGREALREEEDAERKATPTPVEEKAATMPGSVSDGGFSADATSLGQISEEANLAAVADGTESDSDAVELAAAHETTSTSSAVVEAVGVNTHAPNRET